MDIPNNDVISVFNYAFLGLCKMYDEQESKNITSRLFDHYFSLSRADLIIRANDKLSESEILLIHKALKKLKEGKPLQYVIGTASFYGLELKVNENVLIPRPETEELVDWIVNDYKDSKGLQILDIGTGSGCIAIALEKNLDSEVFACDLSSKAIETAKENLMFAKSYVNLLECDFLLNPPPLKNLDIIVSNPPYIPQKDKVDMDRNVLDYEPEMALFVENNDPIIFYRSIAEFGLKALKDNACLYFEINPDYVDEIGEILLNLDYIDIEMRKDISGKNRMFKAKKRPTQ